MILLMLKIIILLMEIIQKLQIIIGILMLKLVKQKVNLEVQDMAV